MQPTIKSAVAVAAILTTAILSGLYLYTRPPAPVAELPAKPGAPLVLRITDEICDITCLENYERERGLTPMRDPDRPASLRDVPPTAPGVPL